MIDKTPIHNSLHIIRQGIRPDQKHNRSIRGYKKALYYITLYVWHAALVIAGVCLIVHAFNLI